MRNLMQEDAVNFASRHLLSRRCFCLCCIGSATFAASGGWLSPSQVYAEARIVTRFKSNTRLTVVAENPVRDDGPVGCDEPA